MAKATPLRMNIAVEEDGSTATIDLFEPIESGFWGFSVPELNDRLKRISVSTIKVRIFSRGGDALEAFGLYEILRVYKAEIVVEVFLAASAASVVAMAADPGKIFIGELGFLMIHNPWTFADGDASALRMKADMLDTVKPLIVKAYQTHSKLSADELSAAMSEGGGAGTWYDADAAIAAGLAHEVMESGSPIQNSVDFADLKNVPQAAIDLFSPPAPLAPVEGDDDSQFLAAVLDVLEDAPRSRPETQEADAGARLMDLLNELTQEPQDA